MRALPCRKTILFPFLSFIPKVRFFSSFDPSTNLEELALHLTVWDWDRFTDHEFMGQLSVPFHEVLEAGHLDRWFPLLPAPGCSSTIFSCCYFTSSDYSFVFAVAIKMPGTVDNYEGKILSLMKPKAKRQSSRRSQGPGKLFLFYWSLMFQLNKDESEGEQKGR